MGATITDFKPVREVKNKSNIIDDLLDSSLKTENLLPGQTPLRITNDTMRKWNTIQGISIDKKAVIPKDRQNFFWVAPKDRNTVIKRQWKRYFTHPKHFNLTPNSTLEDAVKKFDQQHPENKIKYLRNKGINIKEKLKDFGVSFMNLFIPSAEAEPIKRIITDFNPIKKPNIVTDFQPISKVNPSPYPIIRNLARSLGAGAMGGVEDFNKFLIHSANLLSPLSPYPIKIVSPQLENTLTKGYNTQITPSKNKIINYANQFAKGLGHMGVSLLSAAVTGKATTIALEGNILPKVSQILARVPDFAKGLGLFGLEKGMRKPKTVTGKITGGISKGAENLIWGTIFGKLGGGKWAIPKMAGLGTANSFYESVKRGKLPSKEELTQGALNGGVYGVLFSILPFLTQHTGVFKERRIMNIARNKIKTALLKGDINKIKTTAEILASNSELRPQIREVVKNIINKKAIVPLKKEALDFVKKQPKVYHITDKNFTNFNTEQPMRFGSHFSKRKIDIKVLAKSTGKDIKKAKVIEVTLDIKNPLRLPDLGFWKEADIVKELNKKGITVKSKEYLGNKFWEYKNIIAAIKKAGYDGVIYRNKVEGGGDSIIAFSPDQIKTKSQLTSIWNQAHAEKGGGKGIVKMNLGINPQLGTFYKEDLNPMIKGVKDFTKESLQGIKTLFSPEGKTEETWRGAKTIRRAKAEQRLAEERFLDSSNKRWNFWNKVQDKTRLDFIFAMEEGKKFKNPKFNELANNYRDILDRSYNLSRRLNDKIGYINDYFPHLWDNPQKVSTWLKQYRLRIGSDAFVKQRSIDLIKQGLKAGFKLKSTNPEELVSLRYHSALVSKFKADILDKLEKEKIIISGKELKKFKNEDRKSVV